LWAVFLFASLPEIILQSSSTQNDLVLGFFLFASLYLFIYGVREKEKISLVLSAMALGLSLGIKGSVFMFLPALGIIYIIISALCEKKRFYKPLLFFGSMSFLFFILLSSYNYILNYQEFHNFLGLESYMNFYMPAEKSIKFFIANLIRHNLCLIDFTGFESARMLSEPFLFLKSLLFGMFNLTENTQYARDIVVLNTKIHENYATLGPIGVLVFIPLLIGGVLKGIFSKSDRIKILSLTALIPVIFIPIMSMLFVFTTWNMRYFVTAVVLASPLLALSYGYKLKPLKIIISVIAVVCFINISLCNTLRPVMPTDKISLLYSPREDVRYELNSVFDCDFRQPTEFLGKNAKNNSKIGLIFSDELWYYQFFNQNPTWKIFPLRYELLTEEKLRKLDYIVICNKEQVIYNLNNSKNLIRNNKPELSKFKNLKLIYGRIIKNDFSGSGLPGTFYIFQNKS